MKFTDEQQQVIDSRGENLLVSAAAGSGKTAVLVERIIRKVTSREHPLDIDRLLIVTFTNAAAAQMRERIAAAIERELLQDSSSVHLKRQQTLINSAKITTIHSFCLFVIRNYFHRIDLEPDFRIGEEGELKLLRQDVLRALLEEAYQKAEPEFLQLLETVATGKSDGKLRETILQLYEFAMSDPWPKQWLNDCVRPYACSLQEFCQLPVYQAFLSYLKAVTGQWEKMAALCVSISCEPDGPNSYEELLRTEWEQIKRLQTADTYEQYDAAIRGLNFGRLPAIRKFAGDADKKQQVQELRKEIKDTRKKLIEQFFFLPPEEMIAGLAKNQTVIAALVQVTLDFAEAFASKKKERNMLDFHDLEHLALKILVDEETKEPTQVAAELREQFAEVMIDEYQDSNYVQEAILKAVARPDNRFMVGDVKQSIYRFRMARPELFMEKYQRYQADGSDGARSQEAAGSSEKCSQEAAGFCEECSQPDGPNRKIDLHKNFRSRREVLSLVNDLFSSIMGKDLGNVEYDDLAALHPGMEFPEAPQEEMFASEVLLANGDDYADAEQLQEAEFVIIAQKINQLMGEQLVTEEQGEALRPLRYQDIVILLRGIGAYGQRLAEILKDHGIPAAVSAGTGYFSAVEVQTALNFLRLIDNPRQDIPMAALLRSYFGGLSEEELAAIRVQYPQTPFYQSVFSYQREGKDAALRQKLEDFFALLNRFRRRADDTVIHELLYQALDESGYLDYVSALPGGSVRRANLEMLLERAVAYEKTSYRGLFSFIRYMDQLEKYQLDYGEAEDEALEDQVRIMTIHKSKGLEFPVVFVSGLGRLLNQQDVRSRMVLHPKYGIGLDLTDLVRRVRTPSLMRQILARQIQMENAGEELRVLYVALTRAKEKLILTGALKKAQEKLKAFARQPLEENGRMGFLYRLKAGCYLDWILPSLLHETGYRISLLRPEELTENQAALRIEEEWSKEQLLELAQNPNRDLVEEIERRLSFRYPYEAQQGLKPKLSVSELKHRMADRLQAEEMGTEYLQPTTAEEAVQYLQPTMVGEAESVQYLQPETAEDVKEPELALVPYVPEFIQELDEGASGELLSMDGKNLGALRGTAMHRVLECFDFSREMDTLEQQIEELKQSGRLESRLAELLYLPGLKRFLNSELAKRMQRAAREGKLYREKPFVMGKSVQELTPEASERVMQPLDAAEATDECLVLIQGIIDAFFEENGELVLVDYKTDAVKTPQELTARYRVQMDLYQEALGRITGKQVKERLIYSFRLRETVVV